MVGSASQYHAATSYDRDRMSGHYLDWSQQPNLFKRYPAIEPIPLPRGIQPPALGLSSILRRSDPARAPSRVNLEHLSLILFLAHTFTASARHSGGAFFYRSAASAGALYPTEIYIATSGVVDLHDGLYHFAIRDHAAIPLRRMDPTPVIQKIVEMPEGPAPVLTFFLTAIFFRSAWKYRERSYRYDLLDTGHVIENLALALHALGHPLRFICDFDDRQVNRFLGLDERREVTLAVVQACGEKPVGPPGEADFQALPPEITDAARVSEKEAAYPLIRKIHVAGYDRPPASERDTDMVREIGPGVTTWREMDIPKSWPETMDYPEALFRRRSKRNYVKRPVDGEILMALLESLSIGEGAYGPYGRSVAIGFLAGNAEGLEPGFYLLDRGKRSVGLIKKGPFTDWMAGICLDQTWLASAGIHFLFLANLDTIDNRWGPRGYRYVMLLAGRLGQRIYLAATSMGLGCCGIGALYDGEAADLLGLNRSSRLLYLVGAGKVKRA